ncbi:putative multiple sugar transport system substrate-binding protein [Catenuloplanes nepalensis]|uniref:Multiple sugar transport system substrate-binding protein n=1 Tax=Catenuloplanes nepalensis TaxID=587533 RepID=A0ABT9MU84_9ACTN|nr:multiple monosaccharide ABC transporter substrate-binding protein [Catenuloplanes nepalensis]MDP9794823.1 putative multiple sugar transport system substrate-binding protein [Catenuloplanes nepalensis]
MIRRWAAGLVLVLGLTGCGGGTAEVAAPDRGLVGIAMPTKESQRWIGDGENMVSQFSLLGYDTSLQYADDDTALQVSQIQQMIDDGAKALVIGAIDGTKLKDVLGAAAAAKVPVISYDRLIRGTNDIDYYATFDNFKVGVQQAGYIVQALRLSRGGGPYNLELFAGSSDDNNATFFFNGAMSVLQPYINDGILTVPSGETAFATVATQRWDGKVAKERMTRLLGSVYADERVDAVLSPYDGITRGIIEALTEGGYAPTALPVLTGQDAELESVKLIAAGQQGQTVYKDTRELAKVAVQMVNALVTGGEPMVNDVKQYNNGVKDVRTFLLQPVTVTKDNYQRVLVDGGYYTAAEIGV